MWEWVNDNREWVLSGIGVAVILTVSKYLSLLFKNARMVLKTHWVPIYIQVNSYYLPTFTGFSLLHVRRGGYATNRAEINVEKKFKRVDYKGTLRVRVPCIRRHGFTFKCFVDYGDLPFTEVKRELERQGFTDVSKASGMNHRAFFILPEYGKVKVKKRFLNNEFLPS